MSYVILVTGSRNWVDEDTVHRALREQIEPHPPHDVIVRHGACPTGADAIADRLVRAFWPDAVLDRRPADWDSCTVDCSILYGGWTHRKPKKVNDIHHPGELRSYCPGAGPRRNQEMVDLGADVCLAFPLRGGYGTIGCMKLVEQAGIPLRRF